MKLVRKGGFEPPRYCYRQPLKLVRLPVPPLPRGWARAFELSMVLTTRPRSDTANPQYIRPIQTTTTSALCKVGRGRCSPGVDKGRRPLPQPGIDVPHFEQPFVRALLHEMPVFQHENPIRVRRRREAMRDRQHRSSSG